MDFIFLMELVKKERKNTLNHIVSLIDNKLSLLSVFREMNYNGILYLRNFSYKQLQNNYENCIGDISYAQASAGTLDNC